MNVQLKGLFDRKAAIVSRMNDVCRKLKEGKELTMEENVQFDSWDKELLSVGETIQRSERAFELESQLAAAALAAKPGNGNAEELVQARAKEVDLIYRVASAKGVDKLSDSQRKVYDTMVVENTAFEKYLTNEPLTEFEQRALVGLKKKGNSMERAQSTTGSAGGYTIPRGFISEVDQQLKFISPFFSEGSPLPNGNVSNIFGYIPTETGNDLPFPTNNDTGTVGELLGENSDAFAASADTTFGETIFKAYKFSSKPQKVSNELLQDSAIDIPGFLGELLGTRIARIANTYFTTGTNSSQPHGIVTGATAGKTTAASGAITFPEIIDLVHSVDAAYRRSKSTRFMLNDAILAYLKKLTIGSSTNDNRPLWQPGYSVGAPDTIDGYQYLINNDMANALATTNITMLFGDMSKFAVRQVRNMTFRRLDERFADFDQTAWVLFIRMDSKFKNTAAIKKMTQV